MLITCIWILPQSPAILEVERILEVLHSILLPLHLWWVGARCHTFVPIKFSEVDIIIPPFYSWGNWSSKGKLPLVTQPGNGGVWIPTEISIPSTFNQLFFSWSLTLGSSHCVWASRLSPTAISSCSVPSNHFNKCKNTFTDLFIHNFLNTRMCQSLACVLWVQKWSLENSEFLVPVKPKYLSLSWWRQRERWTATVNVSGRGPPATPSLSQGLTCRYFVLESEPGNRSGRLDSES